MTLSFSILLIREELSSSSLASSVYHCPTILTTRIDDNTGESYSSETHPTEASIDLRSLLAVNNEIDERYKVLTYDNLFFTDEDLEIEVGNSPNPERDSVAIRTQLRSDLQTTSSLLNQAWNQESWQTSRELLIRLMEMAQPTELIRLVISTNDPRIESIFFQEIESIRQTSTRILRNISVKFVPL
jgi:hypothetical protein